MDTMTHESWLPIPGLPGYEVSDFGRVRSWHRIGNPRVVGTGPADEPRIIEGSPHGGGEAYFRMHGGWYTARMLARMALGEEPVPPLEHERPDFDALPAEDWEQDEDGRPLHDHELREIRELEGFKTAEDVADEFNIEPERVRRVWDRTGD